MAEMGNTASDASTKSDDAAMINNSPIDPSKELPASDSTSAKTQTTFDVPDIKRSDESRAEDVQNSLVSEDLSVQSISISDTTDDSKVEVHTDSSKEEVGNSVQEIVTGSPIGASSPKSPIEANKPTPATPPATPVANKGEPIFPSPQLDTTFTLSADGDSVSNPAIPPTTPSADKPPTLVDAITAPILEAAAIANAVAGISISNPATPVALSSSSGEPVFSSGAETSQDSKQSEVGSSLTSGEISENGAKSVRDEEVEVLRARIQTLETELVAALSRPGTKNHVLVETIKQQHEELLSKARGMLFDKTKIVKNQELQIEALSAQVASLKDVNSITKDLLEIRNSEIKHLEDRLNNMEARFKAEKEHHMLMLKRAETGQNINNDLKTEYEGQLKIFKDLREMYDQRVQALVTENQRLKECLIAAKASAPST